MNKILNLFNKIVEFFALSVKTKIAFGLISSGIILLAGYNIAFSGEGYYFAIDNTSGILTNVLGSILILVGMIMSIITYIGEYKKNILLYYVRGLDNMNNNAPIKVISKKDRFNCQTYPPLESNKINSYNQNDVIRFFNFEREYFRRKTDTHNKIKVYIASLGSFPFLFLLGRMFNNAYINTEIMDYNRFDSNGGIWYRLNQYSDDKITHVLMHDDDQVEEKLNELKYNGSDEVGIALGYTFSIEKSSIREDLRENTLYLEPSIGKGHDKLNCKELQEKLLQELSYYMGELANSKKTIHLFVSAQASMCINIGLKYMPNAHTNLLVYNYDSSNSCFNWNIEVI